MPTYLPIIQSVKSTRTQPAIPAAILAAAVVLSISSAADVTVAAVLMNAGRQVPARTVVQGESLGQWLCRFTDAARQMRGVLTGDEVAFSGSIHAAAFTRLVAADVLQLTGVVSAELMTPPHAPPMIALLTDLPPPRG
jgi:hypothetical protein